MRILVLTLMILSQSAFGADEAEAAEGNVSNTSLSQVSWFENDHYSGWVLVYKLKSGREYKAFHGKGVYIDDSGNRYDGEWVKGLKFGKGSTKYANGDGYNGTWEDDVRNGKGIMIYKNLDRYDGYWVEGQRDGEGVMIYANGDKYNGLWKGDKWHGEGKLTCADYSEYIGDWTFNKTTKQDDLLRGKVIYTDGRTYEGELEGLTEYGSGVMTDENGSCYDGQWWNGKKHGPGTFTLKDKSTIKGDWENDEIRVGTRQYYSGEVYTGELYGLLPHGTGKMVYQGRIIHDGNWSSGEKKKACLSKEKPLSSPRGTSPRTIWEVNLAVSTNPTWARAAQNNPKIRRTPTYWEGCKIFDKEGEDVSGHLIRPLVEHFVSSVTRRT